MTSSVVEAGMARLLGLCVVCFFFVWGARGEEGGGGEGRGEKGYGGEEGKLLMAAVLTRHGDRTPVRVFPNTRSEWPEVGRERRRRRR